TPSSARTSVSSRPYTFTASTARAAAAVARLDAPGMCSMVVAIRPTPLVCGRVGACGSARRKSSVAGRVASAGRWIRGLGAMDRVRLEVYAPVVREADAAEPGGRYREAVTTTLSTRVLAFGERLARANPWVVDGVVAALFVLLGVLSTQGRG